MYPILTIQVEKRCVPQSDSGISPLVVRLGSDVTMADPTASPLKDGRESKVAFLEATGLLQKVLYPALEKSFPVSF